MKLLFIFSKLLLNPRFRQIVTILSPFLITGLVGITLEADLTYFWKTVVFFLVSCSINMLAYTVFDERYKTRPKLSWIR